MSKSSDPRLPEDWTSPGDAIKKFIAELTDTIREGILVGCAAPFFEPPSLESLIRDSERGYQAKFNSILDDVRPRDRATECAKLIGVMELRLEHRGGDEAFWKKMAEANPEEHPDLDLEAIPKKDLYAMAARAPLRDAHFRAARSKFYELRTTVLSPQALHLWELLLEEEDPIFP